MSSEPKLILTQPNKLKLTGKLTKSNLCKLNYLTVHENKLDMILNLKRLLDKLNILI